MPVTQKTFWLTLGLCSLFGAVMVAAFAPLEWAPLAFICVAALFYLCRNANAKDSFFYGLGFGYGLFGAGVSWVYVSLHTYGGMPLWMGSIAVLGFAGILAIFIAFTTYAAARLVPGGGMPRILAMAGFWLVFEWTRSWILTGFPWLELGYTQTPTWLFAFAPVGGVYLVSFTVIFVAVCLLGLVFSRDKLLATVGLLSVFALAWIADQQNWTDPIGEPLAIGLVQPNVPINNKWQAQYRDQVIARLRAMSSALRTEGDSPKQVDLVVWPETALPLYYQQTDEKFWASLLPADTAVLTGIADAPFPNEAYNAAILSCDGQQQVYRKRHLVPFGEYLPLRFLFNWVLEYLELPMSDFSSWAGQQTLSCAGGIKIALSICYEDAFASEMRDYVGDATLLVNISEDAWFGDSLAPHQRLQMAQMRARELSRPLVRSANTGPSVVIDHRGKVVASTGQFSAESLVHAAQPHAGDTPYKRFGNWIVWLMMLLLVALGARERKRQ
ncbi:MAG: apolipoprotein N-acyltransferase [Pseudomonadota bacterium]